MNVIARGALALVAAGLALGLAGCATTTPSGTPLFGYVGPPLFAFEDGYVEDRSPTGPLPSWAQGPAIPGSRRYWWIPGSEEWYTFPGPAGVAGETGQMGPQGLAGVAGPSGLPGTAGESGARGPRGLDGEFVVERR